MELHLSTRFILSVYFITFLLSLKLNVVLAFPSTTTESIPTTGNSVHERNSVNVIPPVPVNHTLGDWSAGLFGTLVSVMTAFGQVLTSEGEQGHLKDLGQDIIQFIKKLGGSMKLYMFRSKNPTRGQLLTPSLMQSTTFNLSSELVTFIIHGFTQSGFFASKQHNQQHSLKIKDAILKIEPNACVILVDWTYLSSSFDYLSSSKTTSLIGKELADLVVDLINRNLLKLSTTTLVGFSLGAHIAGIVGEALEEKTGLKLPRIDALDPAGLGFDYSDDMDLQLSQDDASFVQVIHCNKNLFGTSLTQRGHVEFFPNGGEIQPGCDATTISSARNVSWYPSNIAKEHCNHVKCNEIYAEGVTTEQVACPCESLELFHSGKCNCTKDQMIRMGYFCPVTSRGTYYLNVTISPNTSNRIHSYFSSQENI